MKTVEYDYKQEKELQKQYPEYVNSTTQDMGTCCYCGGSFTAISSETRRNPVNGDTLTINSS